MFLNDEPKLIYVPKSLDEAQAARLGAWLRQTIEQFGKNLLRALAPWPA